MQDTTITNVDKLIANINRQSLSPSDNNYSMNLSKTRFVTTSPKFYDEDKRKPNKVKRDSLNTSRNSQNGDGDLSSDLGEA